MNKQRLQQKKKKEREAIAKQRVEARRQLLREDRKNEARRALLEKKLGEKGETVYNDPVRRKTLEEAREARALVQLEHNRQILEALEKQYEEEQNARKQIHEDLEAKGLNTLEEKMEFLKDNAEQEAKKQYAKKKGDRRQGFKFGGQAEVAFTPKEETENSSES